jgi:hypothetical protein
MGGGAEHRMTSSKVKFDHFVKSGLLGQKSPSRKHDQKFFFTFFAIEVCSIWLPLFLSFQYNSLLYRLHPSSIRQSLNPRPLDPEPSTLTT